MHRRLGCDERSASGAVRASSSFEILNPRPFGLQPALWMMIRISVPRITSLLVPRRRGLRSRTGYRNMSGACRPPPNYLSGHAKPHANTTCRGRDIMPRYVAFLRGISPLNAKMLELKGCFERVGFTSVKTVLSSGNVVFDARASTEPTLEHRAEAAMEAALGRSFFTIVRPIEMLQSVLKADPYAAFEL